MKVKAEVIIIGNELLKGRTREGNGHYLTKVLGKHSIHTNKLQIIGDDHAAIAQSVELALATKPELIFVSGGLGPTEDDLTKTSLANIFEVKMTQNELAATITKENYKRMQRPWKPELNFYHHFPKEFTPLNNPVGLAPGIFFTHNKILIFVLPGVPREFRAMLDQECLPIIKQSYPQPIESFDSYTIKTSGLPEENIFNQLCPTLWQDLQQWTNGQGISSLPNLTGIDIVLQLNTSLKPLTDYHTEIMQYFDRSPLAPYIWHYGDEPLAELIVKYLQKMGQTISCAESCTGGLISCLLTDVSGSSEVFPGAFITYSNQQKITQLDVSPKTLESFGAVSPEVAFEMSQGAQKHLKSDYAISITGIAGPGGGSMDTPVGTAYMAITTPTVTKNFHLSFTGDRQTLKKRFSQKALFYLYQEITKTNNSEIL